MQKNKRTKLLLAILLGLVLGSVCGIIFAIFVPSHSPLYASALEIAKPFGLVFINLLKMIVVPVIIFTLISGVANISPSSLGRVGIKIIAFYLITSLFAIIIGLLLGNAFDIGTSITLESTNTSNIKALNPPSLIDTFMAIIPTNPFAAMVKGDVLPIIFFSILFGLGIAFTKDSTKQSVKDSANTVYSFFDGCAQVIFKVVGWVMLYAPIGVFFLIFQVFASNGVKAFGPLLEVSFVVYLGLGIQFLLVYLLIVWLNGLSPWLFLRRAFEPFLVAFITRSSGATLPISMNVAERKMGINKGIYSFTLPLGATINMDGTTIYLGVCAMFIANACGVELSFGAQAAMVVTAVLASIGTAGVPGAGAIMLIMVLESIGLDLANDNVKLAYAMILGIDAILDMGRTGVNVAGDMCGTCVVAKQEGQLDESKWK
ncbi:Na+/dicarboxylate symporter [Campylobacter iguaniorum]|uniref:Na+/dicarboxylate symporter n=1 Tax=Campylobacter iguaniorum TaxID=1244531 RepID=A0A076FAM8_9BACT|nr:dicarboxylate/amino acid:cation symporter [Campylobacter iguaniorum]AII14537.1 Na+/dicarboxylate symporter [Campylobacter iguaniorum]ALV24273.1 Na+/dicarboxylate symporter [Campylobacter iguaniorum]